MGLLHHHMQLFFAFLYLGWDILFQPIPCVVVLGLYSSVQNSDTLSGCINPLERCVGPIANMGYVLELFNLHNVTFLGFRNFFHYLYSVTTIIPSLPCAPEITMEITTSAAAALGRTILIIGLSTGNVLELYYLPNGSVRRSTDLPASASTSGTFKFPPSVTTYSAGVGLFLLAP